MSSTQRPTVPQIQAICKRVFKFVPTPCEIAEGKERLGHRVRRAWNRQGQHRQHIRPTKMRFVIAILRFLGW